MSTQADSILAKLEVVAAERAHRSGVPGLDAEVVALKEFQQRRFAHTYADLLASPRYAPAARFFMEELYGPQDFTRRDTQFARVVPALVLLFPREIVEMVNTLGELHALSEALDSRMGKALQGDAVDAAAYANAWRATGGLAKRKRQIALTLQVGTTLDELTRKPLLRSSLQLMRGPAHAAGLKELQQFLEAGFDTFKAMQGATEFLALVNEREKRLAAALFAGDGAGTVIGGPGSEHSTSLLP